ncbi:secretin [Pseudomonas stutzeri]|nr:secretin [Stutzerimonas stutzeri]
MNARLLLAILGLACSLTGLAAPRTEILPLGYRTADELLPLAQSLLAGEGRVSAYGNQLVVNAEPHKIAELRQLLEQLDTPPKRLLISVDSSQEHGARLDDQRIDGSIGIGDVEILAGQGERHGRDQVRIIRRSTRDSSGSLQQVQATEGYPALIQAGQRIPVLRHERDPYGHPRQYTEYLELDQGFEVIASVQGERVQLSIRSRQDRLTERPGTIDTQSTDTRVSGRLGEWIELGGFEENRTLERPGLLSRQTGSSRRSQSLRLKVELLE